MTTQAKAEATKMREWIDRVGWTFNDTERSNGHAETAHLADAALEFPIETLALGFEYNLLPLNSVKWAACALAYTAGEKHVFWGRIPFDLVEMIERGCLPEKIRAIRSASCIGGVYVLYEGDGFHLFVDSTKEGGSRFSISSKRAKRAMSVGLAIRETVPEPTEDGDSITVDLWMHGSNGVESRSRIIQVPSWADVALNYPTSTRSSIDWIMGLTPEDLPANGSRLVVWHGAPGTGKTYALRALMKAWRRWCDPHIIIDPEQAFHQPRYLLEVVLDSQSAIRSDIRDPWKLVIVEDADLLLRTAQSNSSKPALDRLLNLCDGLLGQGMPTLVLLTTNMRIAKLPPALVRSGRCLAITEFTKFSVTQARSWLGGIAPTSGGEQSLAELFEARGDTRRVGEFAEEPVGMYL
ncbi:MAG TPA: DUF5925 domain-containing protein [Acidimicrobiales bacterium]|nr:DUF5925 domain-containing protein [Acidimicrobiales bacterium]